MITGVRFELHLTSLDGEPAGTELPVLLRLLQDSALWTSVSALLKDWETTHELSAAEAIVAEAGSALTLGFVAADDPQQESHELSLEWNGANVVLSATYRGEHLQRRRAALLADAVTLAREVAANTRDGVCVGPIGGLRILFQDLPRRRPPRAHPHYKRACVVDFLSPRFQLESNRGHSEDYGVLAGAELPAGVERTTADDLTVIRWTKDLEVDLADVVLRRDLWLREHLELPLTRGYNLEGDEQVDPGEFLRHQHLAFYDDYTVTAYKPIFFDGSREDFDAETEALRGWIRDGKAPDGTEVGSAIVVVPLRELALAAIEFGGDSGITGAYYPSEDGSTWWNPTPAGNWVD